MAVKCMENTARFEKRKETNIDSATKFCTKLIYFDVWFPLLVCITYMRLDLSNSTLHHFPGNMLLLSAGSGYFQPNLEPYDTWLTLFATSSILYVGCFKTSAVQKSTFPRPNLIALGAAEPGIRVSLLTEYEGDADTIRTAL